MTTAKNDGFYWVITWKLLVSEGGGLTFGRGSLLGEYFQVGRGNDKFSVGAGDSSPIAKALGTLILKISNRASGSLINPFVVRGFCWKMAKHTLKFWDVKTVMFKCFRKFFNIGHKRVSHLNSFKSWRSLVVFIFNICLLSEALRILSHEPTDQLF